MDNLIFSLNATIPVFLMMVLGYFFNKIGWIDDEFASKMNKFVFRVPLPVLLFGDLATVDFSEVWDMRFVLFCFAVTVCSITIAAAVSCLWSDRSIKGEFIQVSYRSSAALLGIAFIQNIYGTAGMAPLMIIGSVPLYNVMAVLVLSLFKPGQQGLDQAMWKRTLKGIVTNPIILSIVTGLAWSALHLPMPVILNKAVSSVGGMATPMGLMAMGATFDFGKALSKVKPTVVVGILGVAVELTEVQLILSLAHGEEPVEAGLLAVGTFSGDHHLRAAVGEVGSGRVSDTTIGIHSINSLINTLF